MPLGFSAPGGSCSPTQRSEVQVLCLLPNFFFPRKKKERKKSRQHHLAVLCSLDILDKILVLQKERERGGKKPKNCRTQGFFGPFRETTQSIDADLKLYLFSLVLHDFSEWLLHSVQKPHTFFQRCNGRGCVLKHRQSRYIIMYLFIYLFLNQILTCSCTSFGKT